MILFATPDFGAGGCIMGFLLLVWAAVLISATIGFVWGMKKFQSTSSKSKKIGTLLMIVSATIPLLCCFGPSQVVRLTTGNYPLGAYPNNKIREGMTMEEVTDTLGTPHQRSRQNNTEHWMYWLDSFAISYFGVSFGPDGRVTSTHGN